MSRIARSWLTLMLIALVIAAGALTYRLASRHDPSAATPFVNTDGSYRVGSLPETDAEAAVKAAAATLPVALSYDYRSLDKSLAAATKQMTPSFARQFTDTFNATTRSMATQKHAIVSALVRGAGIVGSVKGDSARVLVYLDQVLVSTRDQTFTYPLRVSQNRVVVDLRRIDSHWEVNNIIPF